MTEPLEEEIGGMIVCDKVWLGVVSTSYLLSCEKSQLLLVDETFGRGSVTTEFLLEDLCLGR